MLKNKIGLDKKEELMPYLWANDHQTSGLTFTSLYMWREENDFEYEIIGDYLCLTAMSFLKEDNYTRFLMPPLPLSGRYDRESLRDCVMRVKEIFESQGHEFSIRLVPDSIRAELSAAFPEMVWQEDRSNFDYLYDRREIEELKGKRFHAKKNFVNSFRKNYEYTYEDINSSMKDEIMEFINLFVANKENISKEDKLLLIMEERAVEDVFANFEEVGYIGGLIRIDGIIRALAVCGRSNPFTVVEHIEKADTSFRGLYPTMLNELAKHLPREIRYINREEDMGLDNLRKAKLSFRPCRLIEKYIGSLP